MPKFRINGKLATKLCSRDGNRQAWSAGGPRHVPTGQRTLYRPHGPRWNTQVRHRRNRALEASNAPLEAIGDTASDGGGRAEDGRHSNRKNQNLMQKLKI